MNHEHLCKRARRWLEGSRRCNLVLSGIASTSEIPDAIGWCTAYKWYGSIVVECKISLTDFHRDKRKKHPERMGVRRYFLVPWGLVNVYSIEKHYPDHGLLYAKGRQVIVAREAPERAAPDLRSEIRLLQFALIHLRMNLGSVRSVDELDFHLMTKHPFTVMRHLRRLADAKKVVAPTSL